MSVKNQNIILTGLRGSGKSTIGKILSQRLKKNHVETDFLIEKKEKLKPGRIIQEKGIEYFRKIETKVIKEIMAKDNQIISTGGGVIENESLMTNLKKHGLIVYLKNSPENLFKRIGNDPNRPLLTKSTNMLDDLKNLYAKRKHLYEKYADMEIETQNQNLLSIKPYTKLCCLIGNPVGHSLSALMHNSAYKELGLNYIYFALKAYDLKKTLQFLKNLKVTGISVTIPFKTQVLKYCDALDKTVKEIGAANTLIFTRSKLHAFNTDAAGSIKALKQAGDLKNKKAIVRGAGGAARAIAYGLKNEEAKVKILNRTISRAKLLVKELNLTGVVIEKEIHEIKSSDILINASSLGMKETDPLPFPESSIKRGQLIFDIVYNPLYTKLLKHAKKRRSQIIPGYKMLLYQAIEQFELFTGKKAPIELMEKILIKSLKIN